MLRTLQTRRLLQDWYINLIFNKTHFNKWSNRATQHLCRCGDRKVAGAPQKVQARRATTLQFALCALKKLQRCVKCRKRKPPQLLWPDFRTLPASELIKSREGLPTNCLLARLRGLLSLFAYW